MSRWPLSISPSIEALPSLAAQLLLQSRSVDNVPVFGKLAVLDPPDVDGAQAEAPPGRGDPLQWLRVRCREGHARDDLVPLNDPVIDLRLHVRHARENCPEVLDLRREPIWAAA